VCLLLLNCTPFLCSFETVLVYIIVFTISKELFSMTHFLQMNISCFFRKYACRLLALFWVAGFICGIVLNFCSPFSSSMPAIFLIRLSIVEQILHLLIPLLLFSFAVYIRQPLLLCFFLFYRACVVSFVFCTFACWFGEPGWLLSFLCCFSSVLSLPVIFWYASHSLRDSFIFSWSTFFFAATVSVIIAAINYIWILPLVGRFL